MHYGISETFPHIRFVFHRLPLGCLLWTSYIGLVSYGIMVILLWDIILWDTLLLDTLLWAPSL